MRSSLAFGNDKHHDELAAHLSDETGGFKKPLHGSPVAPRPPTVQLNHSFWCSMLPVMCLRSKTRFAAYLRLSFQRRLPPGKLPTIFPIPIPSLDPFGMKLDGLSSSRRRSIHRRRAFHCIIMALNFWHSGGRFEDLDWICRPMSPAHRSIHRRLWAFLVSDGRFPAFELCRAGRRFFQLDARLRELSESVTFSGMASAPYSRDYAGMEVPLDNSVYPELEPYRKMDPERIKISGTGHWDIIDLLPDNLVMPFLEPAVIANGKIAPEGSYPRMTETEKELAALAKVWDRQGLLYVHNFDIPGFFPEEQVRIFGCFKNSCRDRQIGDKRGRNYAEDKVLGPSKHLPAAADLCDLRLNLQQEKVTLSITDRRDFYHQIRISEEKALTNSLGPGLDPSLLIGTDAMNLFLMKQANKRRRDDRLRYGDQLGYDGYRAPAHPSKVFIAFNSVLQGDHTGVEVACASHQQLLQNVGLLDFDRSLLGTRPWIHQKEMQGLVIDDFFSIAISPKDSKLTKDVISFDAAQSAYASARLEGSPDKDIRGASSGKVIGGFVDGSAATTSLGLATVAAPPEKRYGMSWITLQACQLPYCSDALMLSLLGGWTSIAMFRRCFMGLFNEVHHLVDMDSFDCNHPRILPLPRSSAEELVLASVLAPLFQTNIATPYGDYIFATDASETMGAICKAPLDVDLQEVVFRACKSKGSYTRLQRSEEVILHRIGALEDEDADHRMIGPSKPIACRFQFIEVFAGAAVVTDALQDLNISCGPPIELGDSAAFDVKSVHLLRWITHLLVEGFLESCMVEPPCTSFSIMRSPPLRSKAVPFGFDVKRRQTQDGNILGHRGFQILDTADSVGAPCLLETPNSSLLKNLPSWKNLVERPTFEATRVDSCAFGSPHLKSFKFLHTWMRLRHSRRRCTCTGKHLKVEGSLTKASATYVPGLAKALALDFKEAILAAQLRKSDDLEIYGLENVAVNHLALSLDWQTVSAWTFKRPMHINLLETKSVERMIEDEISNLRGDRRIVSLIDSNVARCALAKGRSSSYALNSVVKRIGSLMVAGGIYLCNPYCPTRLNMSDDPTRGRELRSRIGSFGRWSREDFMNFALIRPVRRWCANWLRLVFCLLEFSIVPSASHLPHRRLRPQMDFDQTLGFPGEGPLAHMHLACCLGFYFLIGFGFPLALLGLLYPSPRPVKSLLVLLCLYLLETPGALVSAMDAGPRNHGDFVRRINRESLGPLPQGRLVLEVTAAQRDRLTSSFLAWCDGEGLDMRLWINDARNFLEEINLCLCKFGRTLYDWGRPLNHFVETINALTSWKPELRRQVQAPWDIAFNWSRLEPNVHHVAAPFQIIMALLSVALMWGWLPIAGAIAMMWGALLRPCELTSAIRQQLTLPSDLEGTIAFGILAITEPKTRFSAASGCSCGYPRFT